MISFKLIIFLLGCGCLIAFSIREFAAALRSWDEDHKRLDDKARWTNGTEEDATWP